MTEAVKSTTWGGKTLSERRAARRVALVEAGLECFADEGFAGSSINRICKLAGVSERYFYEEYGNKEGLLIAVYEALIADTMLAVEMALSVQATTLEDYVRSAADAFTRTLTDDPRRARVNFLEVVGAGQEIEARRRQVLESFGKLILNSWQSMHKQGKVSGTPERGLAMGLVGATQEILIDWLHHGCQKPRSQIVQTLVRVYSGIMGTHALQS